MTRSTWVTSITLLARHRDAEEQNAQLFGPHASLHDDAAVLLLAAVDEDEPPRVKCSERIAGRSGGAPACVSLHLQAKQLAARRSSGGGNGCTPYRAPERVGRGCKMGVDGRGVAEGCKQEGGQATCAPHPTGKGAKKAGPTPAHPVGPPPSGQAPTLAWRAARWSAMQKQPNQACGARTSQISAL
jgi:hypothetical protein